MASVACGWLLASRLVHAVSGVASADYDVIIIGLGPVGSYLAQLLPAYGVRSVLALEKHNETFYSPRAVVWDDYALRSSQAAGRDLSDYMFWHAWALDHRWHLEVCPSGLRSGRAATRWRVSCDTQANDEWWRRSVMVSSGMPSSSMHQPSWEREMRRRLATLEGVASSFGTEVLDTRAIHGLCEVITRPTGRGAPVAVHRARFCVAADGRKSQVRRQLGVGFGGTTFQGQPWIVVDTEVHDTEYLRSSWIGREGNGFVMNGRDGPKTVVDGKVVRCPFVFIVTPAFFDRWWEDANREAAGAASEEERVAIRDEAIHRTWQREVNASAGAGATPHPVGTGFRFEFLLPPGEDTADASDSFVDQLLVDCAEVDPSRLRIIRKVVYHFDSRRASQWRAGPVFLAGDAAHSMPPFQGQGMNSGLRDVANLAWKLALVLRGLAGDGLLDSYEPERRANLQLVTWDSEALGREVTLEGATATLERDLRMKRVILLRAWFGWQGGLVTGQPHIRSDRSAAVAGQAVAGALMPCPEVREHGTPPRGRRRLLLDDLGAANGLTLVLCGGRGLDAGAATLPASERTLWLLRQLSAAAVAVAPHDARSEPPSSRVAVIAGLARSRRCMDAVGHWTRWTEKNGVAGKIIVVRPDKYIFGFFSTVDEAGEALESILIRAVSWTPETPTSAEL